MTSMQEQPFGNKLTFVDHIHGLPKKIHYNRQVQQTQHNAKDKNVLTPFPKAINPTSSLALYSIWYLLNPSIVIANLFMRMFF
jgi:hypothetical protein